MPKYTSQPYGVVPAVTASAATSPYPQHIVTWTADGATYASSENAGGNIVYRPSYSTTPIPAGRGRA
jgi:hypothetical protein